MYMLMGLWASSDCKNSSCATTRLEYSSWIWGGGRNIIHNLAQRGRNIIHKAWGAKRAQYHTQSLGGKEGTISYTKSGGQRGHNIIHSQGVKKDAISYTVRGSKRTQYHTQSGNNKCSYSGLTCFIPADTYGSHETDDSLLQQPGEDIVSPLSSALWELVQCTMITLNNRATQPQASNKVYTLQRDNYGIIKLGIKTAISLHECYSEVRWYTY